MACLLVLFLCVTPAANLRADHVRDVDISDALQMEKFAGETKNFCNEVYPKILKLLSDDTSKLPQEFDLIFKKEQSVPGLAAGTKIYLSADWFVKNPTDLGAIVHEMTHVAQRYAPGAPSHWTEGIADYVRYTLGYTNSWSYPHCAAQFPHYTSGYWCTSAFLMYVEAKYGSKVVLQLNSALRQPVYSDDFFEKATGKKIDDLWADFQKTPAFQPSAAEALKRKESLAKADKADCTAHLQKIHEAIAAYQKKNHKMPDWLSDLVPDYIADTNDLVCPITKRTGKTENFGIIDPKLKVAYLYEFSASQIPWISRGEKSPTMKEFKMRQKELIGTGIPIIRCHLHSPVLNLAYNGKIFESPLGWESLFTNVAVTMEDLSANRLFQSEN